MKNMGLLAVVASTVFTFIQCNSPEPEDVKTTQRLSEKELEEWQDLKYGMFLCYGMSTFSGEEFPDGSAPIDIYDPIEIDVDQWIRVAKEAGMNYVVLTAKHVAGHCLWPSAYTDYSVKDNKNNTSVNYYIPTYAQDMISAGYYARNMELTNLTPGVNYTIPYVFADSLFSTTIVYSGKKNVKIGLGKFKCLAFKPKVLVGSVFGDAYPLTIYVTDDKNRLPLYAKTSILIGTVKFELVSYEGLKNPLTSKIK